MFKQALFCVCLLGAGGLMITPVFAETVTSTNDAFIVSASSTDPVSQPLIFQMADGRYYHPATGLSAATREELLCLISNACAATATSSPPTATSTVQVVVPVATSTEPVLPSAPMSFPLKDAISRAKTLLQDAINSDLAAHPKKKVLTYDNGWRDVTVALWDPETDQISTVDIQKKGTNVKMKSGEPKIKVTYTNGINSTYEVADGSKKIPVAIRYQIYTEKRLSRKKVQYTVNDVVYTPYSKQ
ncbi:MAG TPA: hypothetical protein VFQ60_05100, partial [Patescibacteria group bacterium]|nr:hypothetical protein [Patescibacteria group bacterium]